MMVFARRPLISQNRGAGNERTDRKKVERWRRAQAASLCEPTRKDDERSPLL